MNTIPELVVEAESIEKRLDKLMEDCWLLLDDIHFAVQDMEQSRARMEEMYNVYSSRR